MKRIRKRVVFFWLFMGYVGLWSISSIVKPEPGGGREDALCLPDWIEQGCTNVQNVVWIDRSGALCIRDSRGVRWLHGEAESLQDCVTRVTHELATDAPYCVVAEHYSALVALGLWLEGPELVDSLVFCDPLGLPAFEWLGNPLMDRSLRSVQLACLELVQGAVPFSWKWGDAVLRVCHEAALVAHGGIAESLQKIPVAKPAVVLISSEQPSAQVLAFQQILQGSDLLQGTDALKQWSGSQVSALAPATGPDARVGTDAISSYLARHRGFEGAALWIAMLLIAASTLISEDLACIGSGILVSHGGMGMWPAIIACIFGIYVGDLFLYFVGRLFGEQLLTHRPFRWMISRESLIASEKWFQKQGVWVILACRFMPGTRLPVYVAAGVLKAPFLMVSTVLILAAVLWVPILVAASSWIGDHMLVVYERYEQWAVWMLIAAIVFIFVTMHQVIPLMTHRGRRLAYSKWKRLTKWEFWPAKAIYPPVFVYSMLLALKYRSLTLPTLCNPMVPGGGLLDESKLEILRRLRDGGAPVAPFVEISAGLSADQQFAVVKAAMKEWSSDYPVVVKPEQGERGKGVCIVKSDGMLRETLSRPGGNLITQKFAPGIEFGVLYWRYPDDAIGAISSITRKVYTSVVGDGVSTLEQLILSDARAVCSAATFLKNHSNELYHIPEKEEVVKLVEIGTHARGSLFLDACHLSTEALLEAMNRISHSVDGYYLGRFDLKVPDEAALMRGENLQIVELNLLTSEPTHMYDPKHSVFDAWKLLTTQWRRAFEIGAQLRNRGLKPMGLGAFLKMLWQHYTQ